MESLWIAILCNDMFVCRDQRGTPAMFLWIGRDLGELWYFFRDNFFFQNMIGDGYFCNFKTHHGYFRKFEKHDGYIGSFPYFI